MSPVPGRLSAVFMTAAVAVAASAVFAAPAHAATPGTLSPNGDGGPAVAAASQPNVTCGPVGNRENQLAAQPPQPRDIRVQRVTDLCGRPVPPHPVDQGVRADRPAGVGEQDRQHRALLHRTQIDPPVAVPQLDRTQQTKLHRPLDPPCPGPGTTARRHAGQLPRPPPMLQTPTEPPSTSPADPSGPL